MVDMVPTYADLSACLVYKLFVGFLKVDYVKRKLYLEKSWVKKISNLKKYGFKLPFQMGTQEGLISPTLYCADFISYSFKFCFSQRSRPSGWQLSTIFWTFIEAGL